jgi:glycogen debranching enzyme
MTFSTDWGKNNWEELRDIQSEGYHEGSVWPLFTGWAALAQFRLGADLDAHNHMLANLYTNKDFSSGYNPGSSTRKYLLTVRDMSSSGVV